MRGRTDSEWRRRLKGARPSDRRGVLGIMKTVGFAIISTLLIVATSHTLQAKVTGECSNCHTMHNSQSGVSIALEYRGSGTTIGPQTSLVKYNCHGCHISTGTDTICSDGTPIVHNTGGYVNSLAGGNFKEMTSDKTKGHNVAGVTSTTDMAPPGFKALSSPPTGFTQGGSGWGPSSWSAGTQVTCAGEYGCHGDRSQGYDNWQALKGAHHGDDSSIDGSTVGESYRFLAGITGAELNSPSSPTDYRWERQADSTHHNGYKGDTGYGSTNTISYLCGECHGNYHAHTGLGGSTEVGTASPWLRHPTDKLLSGGEYASYTTYDTVAPPALASPATDTQDITGGAIVMCLSCHRAHGSPYYKLMRWDYKNWPGGNNGCGVCHTSKN
jgi:hypothetical protein